MRITETTVAEAPTETLAVVAAEIAGAYKLILTFATGECQEVDFGPFLHRATHPAIQAYLDENRFHQFAIVNGNVNWNDYDLIFPVAQLYAGKVE
ncbi:MAG: hypothetical protein JWR44_2605 [Hymenobacter sp.]|jgi:hypothetical protein|nr:hypothetical protein [Hymenobacter sp.]